MNASPCPQPATAIAANSTAALPAGPAVMSPAAMSPSRPPVRPTSPAAWARAGSHDRQTACASAATSSSEPAAVPSTNRLLPPSAAAAYEGTRASTTYATAQASRLTTAGTRNAARTGAGRLGHRGCHRCPVLPSEPGSRATAATAGTSSAISTR